MKTLNTDPIHVVQCFIEKCDPDAGDSITHLKIQKLLYYVQAWGIVLKNAKVFAEDFQAWTHGPVMPTVYHELKKYGFENLAGKVLTPLENNHINSDVIEVIEEVWDAYGELSAKHLENLTHQETPWLEARGNTPPTEKSNQILSLESIRICYSNMLKKNEEYA